MKKKLEYYVKNIKNDNIDFNIYLFHLDAEDKSFNNKIINNSKVLKDISIDGMLLNKLSFFILFVLIIIFYYLIKYNIIEIK